MVLYLQLFKPQARLADGIVFDFNENFTNFSAETLRAMSDFSKFTTSELVNTALKRFMSQHKDFLPHGYGKSGK